MISVPYPHMALNSHDVPGIEYKMWNTWKVAKSTSVDQMIENIARVAKTAPGGCLSTLIFNSHGKPGKIHIGQGITRNDVEKFASLKAGNLVTRIWIVACKVASIKKAGSITDGNYFCYRLAQEAGAFVKAGSTTQTGQWNLPFNGLPYGFIDDWEGTVYTWNSKGELI